MNIILNFLTGFAMKFLTTSAIEKVVLILLEKLVTKTESKIDDDIYQAVFKKVN